jgi:hypothetical protein
VASQQLTMFLTDHEKLSDARDNAAYRCVGAIASALGYSRSNRMDEAFRILSAALENYERAESKLSNYKSKGAQNGNRTAAA